MQNTEDFQYINMSSAQEAEDYYSEKGEWVVANIKQSVGWTEKKTIVNFRNTRILLLPQEKDSYCAAAILCKDGISPEKARTLLNHFFSSLSWSCQAHIRVDYWSGGGRPHVMGKTIETNMLSRPFRIWYLPDSTNPATRLALAFYREALSLRDSAYGFLSFYKIINLKHRKGPGQKSWMEKQLASIKDYHAKERLDALRKEVGSDSKVAEYLYHSCRCAIAHADTKDTTINPENYEDTSRLTQDLPLIKELAEILIEQEYKVLTTSTIYKKHPYELFGFKQLLDGAFINRIVSGDKIEEIVFLKVLSLRLWGEQPYKPLEFMNVIGVEAGEGQMLIQLLSQSKRIQAIFALDFSKNKIIFNPIGSISHSQDDGSADHIEDRLAIAMFLKRYWMNGILEIWDSNMDKCLGFSNPFIPVNIDMSATVKNFDAEISVLKKEFEVRKGAKSD